MGVNAFVGDFTGFRNLLIQTRGVAKPVVVDAMQELVVNEEILHFMQGTNMTMHMSFRLENDAPPDFKMAIDMCAFDKKME